MSFNITEIFAPCTPQYCWRELHYNTNPILKPNPDPKPNHNLKSNRNPNPKV